MSLATEHVSLQHIIPPAYADNERREGLRLLLDLRRLDQGVGKRPDARGCNQASERSSAWTVARACRRCGRQGTHWPDCARMSLLSEVLERVQYVIAANAMPPSAITSLRTIIDMVDWFLRWGRRFAPH